MTYVRFLDSPLGKIGLASDGTYLTGLWFEGQTHDAENVEGPVEERNCPVFETTVKWLQTYFEGTIPLVAPELRMKVTPFRKAVYEALLTVPYGQTVSYGQIARLLKQSGKSAFASARAVGNAVAHNPILLIVPCHRVIGADGSMIGFAGGIERKRKLLQIERDYFKKFQNCC